MEQSDSSPSGGFAPVGLRGSGLIRAGRPGRPRHLVLLAGRQGDREEESVGSDEEESVGGEESGGGVTFPRVPSSSLREQERLLAERFSWRRYEACTFSLACSFSCVRPSEAFTSSSSKLTDWWVCCRLSMALVSSSGGGDTVNRDRESVDRQVSPPHFTAAVPRERGSAQCEAALYLAPGVV